jgi:hypothetical protein
MRSAYPILTGRCQEPWRTAADLARTKAFYSRVFGWKFADHGPGAPGTYGAAGCAAAACALALTAAAAIWIATGCIVRMDPTAALRAE